MTLDIPHGPITKFLKKCPKNAGKMRGKIIFSPLWCLIKKLDHNSGLHAKNQREISKNEVRNPTPHPLYGNVDIPLYIQKLKLDVDWGHLTFVLNIVYFTINLHI